MYSGTFVFAQVMDHLPFSKTRSALRPKPLSQVFPLPKPVAVQWHEKASCCCR